MSEHDDRKEPRTAVEEVLREVEEAERRAGEDPAGRRRHRGEAGEAVTPNTEAQEESRGD
ncbi:hypothetical protein [Streptomyces griseomycini]|uniref:Uncharacterized protein n=1 Tax=Streptomyces griseomycini TaxID=66895 RepID=A0A7W7PU85_9ACTN|nr:hypothetical protein [Streptomyces griseomycini]MBB4901404.1 hypothetical protein [Streptomyces griseomycini]GGQ14444.1 hypothetical protein GCM10010266_42130 [Streptomyces griseomycini]GGR24541.1 hypothetical protein GCM10015536_32780 [Streptomyces griseomycini]